MESTPARRENATMSAVVQDRYGQPDVLRVARIARPEPGPGEVLVRVRAAGVDRGAWHLTTGLPYPVRLAGYGVRRPKGPVRGREVAGVVEAVGSGVSGFRPGEEVFGIAEGGFAEFARADASKLAPAPHRLTPVQAAALPISGITALQAVRDHGRVRAGQRVLVIGASGGVGSHAVQLAKGLGAHVTGVCSGPKTDLVRALGADEVLDYRRDDLAATARSCGGFDVVVDTGGNRSLRVLRRLLTPTGTLVLVGGETGGRWLAGMGRVLAAAALRPVARQRLRPFIASENAEDLAALAALADAGTVTPAVERTVPLTGVAEALRFLAEGHARGKLVVEIATPPAG